MSAKLILLKTNHKFLWKLVNIFCELEEEFIVIRHKLIDVRTIAFKSYRNFISAFAFGFNYDSLIFLLLFLVRTVVWTYRNSHFYTYKYWLHLTWFIFLCNNVNFNQCQNLPSFNSWTRFYSLSIVFPLECIQDSIIQLNACLFLLVLITNASHPFSLYSLQQFMNYSLKFLVQYSAVHSFSEV